MPSPIATATLQAGGLNAISNIIAQILSAYRAQRSFALEFLPLARFIAIALICTPPNYQWQAFLERKFPGYPDAVSRPDIEMQAMRKDKEDFSHKREEAPRKLSWKNTLTKWGVDQSIGAFVNTMLFLSLMSVMKGQSGSQISQNVWGETFPIMFAGYKVWPLASIISFTFIPVERRIVFLSFIGLLWGIYMSLVAERV